MREAGRESARAQSLLFSGGDDTGYAATFLSRSLSLVQTKTVHPYLSPGWDPTHTLAVYPDVAAVLPHFAPV